MIKAHYTVTLYELMKDSEAMSLIDKALNSYPIYESKSKQELKPNFIPTRSELNTALLNYYKYREIGFETPLRFIDELEIAMKEIMPYYNDLMFSADQDFNIIYNVDYVRESTSETQGNGTSNTQSNVQSESNDNSKQVHSETPNNQLNITSKDIDTLTYADDVVWNKGDVNTQSDSESSTENITASESKTRETTKGNFGVVSAQDLIAKYRDTIINIQQQIINDKRIKELFMLVY